MIVHYNQATTYLKAAIAKATTPADKSELTNALSAVMSAQILREVVSPDVIMSMSTADYKLFEEFKKFQQFKTISQ